MRKNNGVTIASIVVTIIIMLIITGTVVSNVIGEDGIITKALNAKNAYETGAEVEQNTLNKN